MSLNLENLFILEHKITFDVSQLNTAKNRFDLKKCLANLNLSLKLNNILLPKNNNCSFDTQIKIFYIIQCVQLTCA